MNDKEDVNDTQKKLKLIDSKISKIEAKDEANSELRRLTNDKIDRLRENIGELKETVREIQSERKEFEVSISKTQALVKSVQPEALRKDIRRLETVDSLSQGKFDMLQKKFLSFESRFQSFEEKLRLFKGHEELLQLQSNVTKDLRKVEKTMHMAEVHASKIENHFVKINERVNLAVSLIEEAREIESHIESFKLDDRIKQLDLKMNELDSLLKDTKENNVKDLTEVVSRVFQKVKSNFLKVEDKIIKIDSKLKELDSPIQDAEVKSVQDLTLAVSDAFKKVESDMNIVQSRLAKLEEGFYNKNKEGQ
jgi:chromosome segregation ATPase